MGFEFLDGEDYVLASYMPRAFYITLNVDTTGDTPDELNFSQQNLSVLMHECAHLAQDRTTLFGALDFLHFCDAFWSIRKYSESTPDAEPLRIPLRLVVGEDGCLPGEDEPCGMAQVEAIRAVTYANRPWRAGESNWAFQSRQITNSRVSLAGWQVDLPSVTLDLIDNESGDTYQRSLGAWELKEGYSVAVQMLHGGDLPSPQDGFEYLIVERILTSIFGEVEWTQIVAICHWSLQNEAPADFFFRIVEQLQADAIHPLPPCDELYDYCRDYTLAADYRDREKSICSQLEHLAAGHDEMNQGGNLSTLLNWYARDARRHLECNRDPTRRFPLDTFLCQQSAELTSEQRTAEMRNLFEELPVPMVQAINGQNWALGGHSLDDGNVFYIQALKHLVDRVWLGSDTEWRCVVLDGCNLEMKDDSCGTMPWRKGQLNQCCSYGGAAKLLQLATRSFLCD